MSETTMTIASLSQMDSPRRQFWAGVRAELPLLLGVVPFGLIYGITAVAAGLPVLAAQLMSSIVFAGSAQFVFAQLAAAGAPGLVIVATVFVVNLRHALYSASVANYLRGISHWWRWLLAYLLTDEAYAVAAVHYEQNPALHHKKWFLLGSGVTLWVSWQISTAAGVFLGASVPPTWPLDFALPLTFIALVVPLIRGRASIAAAIVAGIVVLLAAGIPYKLGLLVAAFAGMAAGVALERDKPVSKKAEREVAP